MEGLEELRLAADAEAEQNAAGGPRHIRALIAYDAAVMALCAQVVFEAGKRYDKALDSDPYCTVCGNWCSDGRGATVHPDGHVTCEECPPEEKTA